MISNRDLHQAFHPKSWGDNNEDIVKLASLYLLHHCMMGADNRKVVLDNFLHLADDLETFN